MSKPVRHDRQRDGGRLGRSLEEHKIGRKIGVLFVFDDIVVCTLTQLFSVYHVHTINIIIRLNFKAKSCTF